jgi:UDP-N-acetylmuramoyl-tripeptide--D-alanyl-D-alanine ligase
VSGAALTAASQRYLHVLQLANYRAREYFPALRKNLILPFAAAAVIGLIFSLSLNLVLDGSADIFRTAGLTPIFDGSPDVFRTAGLIPTVVAGIVCCVLHRRMKLKKPLVYTRRVKRLIFALFLVNASAAFGLAAAGARTVYLRYSLAAALPALSFLTVIAANALMKPYENAVNGRFLRAARRKLAAMPDLTVVGITGSYGKTGVKQYLTAMLSQKYRVCAAPDSFNTPLGTARVVNERLNGWHRILIVEMGARYAGDIAELYALTRPRYGVITGIAPQHLQTFGSLDAVIAEKYSLARLVAAAGGTAVFNADNAVCAELYARHGGGKIFSCGRETATCGGACNGKGSPSVDKNMPAGQDCPEKDCGAFWSDIKTGADGSEFDLSFNIAGNHTENITGTADNRADNSAETVHCRTKLLGRHNVSNLALAAATARKLGVSAANIAAAIAEIEPAPHRLQLLKGRGGTVILDDAYNANTVGARAAADVLASFSGRNRFIITPGITELGTAEVAENTAFGEYLAPRADVLIAVGGIGAYVADGYAAAGGKAAYRAATLSDAQRILSGLLKAGDAVLFENDIPNV